MNRINYNQTGGFPLSTEILDAAQQAYSIFNQYGNMAGEKAIIVGCTELAGGAVTDGFVVINSELLPFRGGQKRENVIIVEKGDTRQFEDGSAKPVIYTRYATFGTSVTSDNYSWVSFRRPLTLFQLEDEIKKVKAATPVGLVAIWGKPADEIPAGWEEHADLAGLVPVGFAEGDADFGILDGTTGVRSVTLDETQMPKHSHYLFGSDGVGTQRVSGNSTAAVRGDGPESPDWNYTITTSSSGTAQYGKSSDTGSGEAHTNIQPSRIVKFIRFAGFN